MTARVLKVELMANPKMNTKGQEWGFNVLHYENGQGAVKKLQEFSFSELGKQIATLKEGDNVNLNFERDAASGFFKLISIGEGKAGAGNTGGSTARVSANGTQKSISSARTQPAGSGYNGDGAQVGQALNGAITLIAAKVAKLEDLDSLAEKILRSGEVLRQKLEGIRQEPKQELVKQQQEMAMQASEDKQDYDLVENDEAF